MDVFFSSKKLQRICGSETLLCSEFGQQNAKKITMRLSELYAVDNLSQISHLPPPRLHQLNQNRDGQFAVDIKQPYRIVFKPYMEPLPTLPDGGIDISKVTRIQIIEIGDYHGE